MHLQPWQIQVPPILYKYLRPDRIDVLAGCCVRFSQRSVFDDDHELQPDYESFGTEEEIRQFVVSKQIQLHPRLPPDELIRIIAESPQAQARVSEVAQRSMKTPDQFGIFCLTEAMDCDDMWSIADHSQGFVMGFDTTHPGFRLVTTPGRLGKVSYSDEPFGTFLGTMATEGAGIFFRKRLKYAFEREWRSIRALERLDRRPGDIFLSSFDPASVREVVIRPECAIEAELRQFLAIDRRYRHVRMHQ